VLNYITPEDIVKAARLEAGKAFRLGLNLDRTAPARHAGGRWNPLQQMLATGTDASPATDVTPGLPLCG
jgi:hypothetical protein